MTGQTIGLLLVMIIYLILMVGIGVLYSKKNNDVSDSISAKKAAVIPLMISIWAAESSAPL